MNHCIVTFRPSCCCLSLAHVQTALQQGGSTAEDKHYPQGQFEAEGGGDDGSLDSLSDGEGGDERGDYEQERLLGNSQQAPPFHRDMPLRDEKGQPQSGHHPPSFMEKLKWMLGSIHVVLFLAQAMVFGYGFGECGWLCMTLCWRG